MLSVRRSASGSVCALQHVVSRRLQRVDSTRSRPLTTGRGMVVFYRWPTMRHLRFISRLKIYQVTCVLLLLPPLTHWYSTGLVGGHTVVYAWGAALGTTAVLGVLSHHFRRFVGEMALHPATNSLQISTLTFLGGRRDLVFPVDHVVPFSDSQSKSRGHFQTLEVSGHSDVYLYSLHHGRILDRELMHSVLALDS